MDITIRRADKGDCNILAALRLEFLFDLFGTPPGPDFTEKVAAYILENMANDTFVCFLAEASGEVISTVMQSYIQYPPVLGNADCVVAYIYNVYTKEKWRGAGIARKLLDRTIADARARGVKQVTLHAEEQAVPLYLRTGFDFTVRDMILRL